MVKLKEKKMDSNFTFQLEKALVSDTFLNLILNCSSPDEQKRIIIRSLNFLISTRDFDNFDYYLSNYYKTFPTSYLMKKGISINEVKSLMYDNYIKNGFLFHVTPSYNVDQILNDGLQTLNDKTGIDLYQESLKINKIFEDIHKRNNGLLGIKSLINIPGEVELNEERFNSIYLSSNLEYILNTYGKKGEFAEYFVRNFFWGFGVEAEYHYMSKKEINYEILNALEDSRLKIKDEEIDALLGFFNIIYHERQKNENLGQSIILIPNKTITSSNKFDMLYRKNIFGFDVPTIIEFENGEVINKGSIPSENLIILAPTPNKSLRLIKK